MDSNVFAQRLSESTVGAENRSIEIERCNPKVATAVGTLVGGEVNLGVRLIKPGPLEGAPPGFVVALPF